MGTKAYAAMTENMRPSGCVRVAGAALVLATAAMVMMDPCPAFAADAADIDRDVAAALDVPIVALYGPTDPARSGPWTKR